MESFANAVVVSIFVEFVALDDFGNIYGSIQLATFHYIFIGSILQ